MKIKEQKLRKIIREALSTEVPDIRPRRKSSFQVRKEKELAAKRIDKLRSAYDSGIGDAQDGMEPKSYHDWIEGNAKLMAAYDDGYEFGLNNPAPKSKMSNAEFKRIYGDMDVGVRGKAGY